jgi:hypothetical protein
MCGPAGPCHPCRPDGPAHFFCCFFGVASGKRKPEKGSPPDATETPPLASGGWCPRLETGKATRPKPRGRLPNNKFQQEARAPSNQKVRWRAGWQPWWIGSDRWEVTGDSKVLNCGAEKHRCRCGGLDASL